MGEVDKQLEQIKKEVLQCRKCSLYKSRIYSVIGEGNHYADIMLIGEAPGLQEARTGHPFCGKAGKVLDELLESIGIKRESVYITNLLKDRPPNNRDPMLEEIAACTPYLERQIKIIKPEVICSLGRYSMRFLMEKFGLEHKIQAISKIHGKVFDADADFGHIKLIPLFHPAVVVYNINMKTVLKKDFEVLKKFV